MMPLIHDDFLLDTPAARELYHRYAAPQPIIDFHNHLPPADIAQDHRWENLTQIWLYGDHYKWRALRSNGISEDLITGPATDRARFDAWAATLPYLVRNPLYHWTALELKRYLEIDDLLSPATAEAIWQRGLERLPSLSARTLLQRSQVEALCTTDDPLDDLLSHQQCAADPHFTIGVFPTWRPDQGLAFDQPPRLNAWIDRLATVSDTDIGDSWALYLTALKKRHDFFHQHGCRLSDHGLREFVALDATAAELQQAFAQLRRGEPVSPGEVQALQSALLWEEARWSHARGWTQQYHFGPLRNVSTRLFRALGPDAGADIIGPPCDPRPLAHFLDRLDRDDQLTKTILYNIHPSDNEVIASLIGAFQDHRQPGKIQFGSAWWFSDQLDGMRRQIESLSQLGLISRFIGMLTDSRSFLSFTRHEYFRRLLCQIFGHDIEKGLLPRDYPHLGSIITDISVDNARRYLQLPSTPSQP
jgi:glucuronate isomerase